MDKEQLKTLQTALENNPQCPRDVLSNFSPIYTPMGASGGKEVLVPVFLDHNEHNYFWYGYIQKATQGKSGYFSLLIWLRCPVNGQTHDQRLASFYDLAWKEKLFEPPTIQEPNEAFICTNTFDNAIAGLAHIISRFDIEKRCPHINSEYYDDPIDLNIITYFGNSKKLILQE